MDAISGRVLLVTPDFPPAPGGIQLVADRLVHHLRRFTPSVLTIDAPGAPSPAPANGGPPVTRIRRSSSHRLDVARLNAHAAATGLRRPPDVVLALHVVAAPAARALARLRGVPWVLYAHADELPDRPGFARKAIRSCDALVAVSRHTADLAERIAGGPPHRLAVITNGVDVPPAPAGPREERPTVVTVARLVDRYKGHDVILRAWPYVTARVPGARWVVVGDGPLRPELERQAAAQGLNGAVLFAGAVSDAERDGWLDRAHVFAMPSRVPPSGGGEGFGIVYLEAGAHGLPVVAGDAGGAVDAVVDGVTGTLVDACSPEAVAGAIADLLSAPERAAALGRAGRAHAEQATWERVAEQVDGVLADVVAERRAA